jgi:hypothetical protein
MYGVVEREREKVTADQEKRIEWETAENGARQKNEARINE